MMMMIMIYFFRSFLISYSFFIFNGFIVYDNSWWSLETWTRRLILSFSYTHTPEKKKNKKKVLSIFLLFSFPWFLCFIDGTKLKYIYNLQNFFSFLNLFLRLTCQCIFLFSAFMCVSATVKNGRTYSISTIKSNK